MVDGVPTPVYPGAVSSSVLACSTVGVLPSVPTSTASTPRVPSRAAGTFAAGQVNVETSALLKPSGPLTPSAGKRAALAPAGHRPRAGTAASCAHATRP